VHLLHERVEDEGLLSLNWISSDKSKNGALKVCFDIPPLPPQMGQLFRMCTAVFVETKGLPLKKQQVFKLERAP